ncbi:MAG: hypothetical protein QXZ31_07115 [Thermofilaceae archaeon]
MRRFAIAMVVYAVLAALDLYTTHLALSRPWAVERNEFLAPLVYAGDYGTLALVNLAAYAPFALMLESRNRYVRLFAAVFLAATVVLRSYVCVNNVMVYLGRGELPWLR